MHKCAHDAIAFFGKAFIDKEFELKWLANNEIFRTDPLEYDDSKNEYVPI